MPEHPIHLAIIPDGNRRWAKQHNLNPWKGHEKAIENFHRLTEWCYDDPRIGMLTVWCFSTENWKRDPEEIEQLMGMLEKYLSEQREKFAEEKVRFVHSGRRDRIPPGVAKLIEVVEGETRDRKGFTLHLAVDYGGKDEIVRATQKLKQESSDITEESLQAALDHPELPDIDLIIRTAGEMRTSNFCLWQTTYAEWVFLEKYFPELEMGDLEDALEEFNKRTRRFGF